MELRLESENGKVLRMAVSGTVVDGSRMPDDPLADLGQDIDLEAVYGRPILLSLRDVKLLNSQGVGWLLRTHQKCDDAGGQLVLHSLPQMARNVLKVMRLDQLLLMATDQRQAERMIQEDPK